MVPGAFATEGVIWMVLYFNLLLEASYISIPSFSGIFLNGSWGWKDGSVSKALA